MPTLKTTPEPLQGWRVGAGMMNNTSERAIQMTTDLDTTAWSAVAAGYLRTMSSNTATTRVKPLLPSFDTIIPDEDCTVGGETMFEAFVLATELGFEIAVATLTLRPDEALLAIGPIVERAQSKLRDLLGSAVPA